MAPSSSRKTADFKVVNFKVVDFKTEVLRLLKTKNVNADPSVLEIPPTPEMGDFAFPCFDLAKPFKKAPHLIARDLAEQLKPSAPIEKVAASGPYLNFFIDKTVMIQQILQQIHQQNEDYGLHPATQKVVVMEYPSPNTNKPLHLGHVRNILIGSSVSHLFKQAGHKVVQVNLNNDRGIHICKSMLAYQKWGGKELPEDKGIKSDHFVGKYYVLFSEKLKEYPELEQEAQQMLVQWEQGDKEVRKVWKLMNAWAYGGFEDTYEKLGVFFDKYYYESNFYDLAKKIVEQGIKKGVFEKDPDGSLFIDFTNDPDEHLRHLGKKIVLRGDGTSIYITQDLHLAKQKYDDYKFDQSVIVTATEQNHHFQILFAILKKLGYVWADKQHHLSYGMVYLPHGKMKSREGTVVDADDLIENMQDLAKVEIRKRHPDLSEVALQKRAHMIGLGALKFFILKVDHQRDIHFNPEESISFEGETGPYVQYAHARICSILKKYGKKPLANVNYRLLKHEDEIDLAKLLGRFPELVLDGAKHYKPSLIAHYLIQVAQQFSKFYTNCQVLIDDHAVQEARILLCYCTKLVLANGLKLLGIEAPEEM
ncbi:MAG: arginyl-tRNA synthetase [archaeon GW2011_AR16]|nr:MAG: arginyl-tRNA synthetase [archaeon GW2011_AR16]